MAPFEIKRAHTTHFIVSCGRSLCKPFSGRYRVSDGVLLVQKLLKLLPLDEFLSPHEHNELAPILQGKLGNAVLPYTKIGSSLWNRQQPLFIERHEQDGLFDGCIGVRKGDWFRVEIGCTIGNSGGHVDVGMSAHSVFLLKLKLNAKQIAS